MFIGSFYAMASLCEVIIDTDDKSLAHGLSQIAASEAQRIEYKFSRYIANNRVDQINNSQGTAINIDTETAHLLNFAHQCYLLSEGLFDISSGILRKAWTFKAGASIPSQQTINKLLPFVGWEKIIRTPSTISVPKGMQIDFGGIGKEYAVDKTLSLLIQHSEVPLLVNFGGDLACNKSRNNGQPWSIGIESTAKTGSTNNRLKITSGAIATSGDSQRYLLKDNKRYGHILNPMTGWPIEHCPRSVTTAAQNCTEAGVLCTLAMLNGRNAEMFLDNQEVKYWCQRD